MNKFRCEGNVCNFLMFGIQGCFVFIYFLIFLFGIVEIVEELWMIFVFVFLLLLFFGKGCLKFVNNKVYFEYLLEFVYFYFIMCLLVEIMKG